ncbi:SDR family NAD(P)-dependent oxidoreductase [Paracoccus sp. IB05]|uniref:SDR family NAD(P)-dependent oxidoreductase n=1 Tax=Paracoccus sp. IB05 TaxID=2779367 RepID=UPI0018E88BC2|nr:SDR family NAD(P)-dependent oxidoreductase [Paracoccus sp. IB05]MBJ2150239.1 SDR family oxidoreductase [Paracoccus sp. IB05]
MTATARFKDKVVIVSGGADGMGAACVRQLAAEGAHVFALDVKPDIAGALAAELNAGGARVEALKADVMDEAELRAAIATVLDRTGGRVDSLIIVAGGSASGLTADIDLAIWDRLYKLNLRSTLVACQAVIPAMRAQGKGSIVTMASISGVRGDPEWAPYNAAKAAILSLTQSLAWEEGGYGIRVNAICPGPIASERMLATISEAELEDYNDATALCRIGRAPELAEAILFLASDQASFITGASLVADGGLTARTSQPTRFYHQRRQGQHRNPA